MFSYSTGYYVSPPDDQYLKFKNCCSLLYILSFNHIHTIHSAIVIRQGTFLSFHRFEVSVGNNCSRDTLATARGRQQNGRKQQQTYRECKYMLRRTHLQQQLAVQLLNKKKVLSEHYGTGNYTVMFAFRNLACFHLTVTVNKLMMLC